MKFNEDFFYSEARRRKKTVESVCAEAGVTHGTIRNWATGKHRFMPDKVEQIAAALGVHPFDLMIPDRDEPAPLMDAPVTT